MSFPDRIGRYEVKRELGRGGMASVYLAYDPNFGREVAVKVLPSQFTHDPEFLARFDQEAHTIAALEHPAIVPVYDYGEYEQQPYLVMRYMAGGSLRQRLAAAGGPLAIAETSRILSWLAPGLDRAHEKGVIHRDLKPDNILFDEDGLPYLGDFGIARLAEASQTMTLIGTPAYMSPEQVKGDGQLDYRCDLYAVGVILFELLSGRPPYVAETPFKLSIMHVMEPIPDVRAINHNLPSEARTVVDRAMAKEPDDRYTTTGELAAAVARLAQATAEAPADIPIAWGETRLEPLTPDAALTPAAAPGTALPSAPAGPSAPVVQPGPPAAAGGRPAGLPTWAWGAAAVAVLLLAALGIWSLVGRGQEGDAAATPEAAAEASAAGANDAAGQSETGASKEAATGVGDAVAGALEEPSSGDAAGAPASKSDQAPAADQLPEPEATAPPTPISGPGMPAAAPALGDRWTRPADGMEMLGVPAGSFTMGSDSNDPDAFPHEFPAHLVTVAGFWIDRTEVTTAQYALCVADGVCEPSVFAFDPTLNQPNLPIVGPHWAHADAYCTWAGGRLPTEAEWEYAARGPENPLYPWGDAAPSCDLAKYNECEGQYPGEVGSFPGSASWVGATEMAGNVWEWVSDWYQVDYYTISPADNPTGPAAGEEKVLRGAGWNDEFRFLRSASRFYLTPDTGVGTIGLRCIVPAL